MNSVSCGRTCEGEMVYIGRGHYDRSLTVGKVFRGDDCLYIPYGGRERRVHRYEVLIKDSFVVPAQNYETTYTKCEPGSYVVPAKTGGCYEPPGYVVPAKTGGCYEPPGYAVPAKTGGGCETGSYVVPAQTGYNQPPSYTGLYPNVSSSIPSISPPPSVAGFIKNEAYSASPYPSPSPQVNAHPPPPSLGFIKSESFASTPYPPTPYAPPTISPAPIMTATSGAVVEMPMPLAPPPYALKEEVGVVHKKPPAFGFQVSF